MPSDPRLEPRRKLICQVCGFWCDVNATYDTTLSRCCGWPMVETYADQGLLSLDQALSSIGRAIADSFRAILHRCRRIDA